MNGQIRVELEELLLAEKELTWLLAELRTDEQAARVLYGRLHEWTGHSANAIRDQIEAFFVGLTNRIHTLEQQKAELIQYVELMKRTDAVQ
ncbi:hypothetical protein [Paenibacillus polymyxa]|uniref:hypothetical protein n=1 Tax=Paenibacillus polymyxa TaxID=1406 RepID=UPI00287FBE84|nr:hypothetical protein [Paenibacillus polymyxa]